MRRKQRGKKVTGFTNTEEAAVGLTKVVSVLVLPGDTFHFHWAKSGEYVTQVTGIGPLGIEYMGAKDDPRNEGRRR